jgi:hypothetical protein
MSIATETRTLYPPTPQEIADFEALDLLTEMLAVFDDLDRQDSYRDPRGRLDTFSMTTELAKRGLPLTQRALAIAVRPAGIRPRSMRIRSRGVVKGYSVTELRQGIERLYVRWTGEPSGFNLDYMRTQDMTPDGALADAIGSRFRARVPLARAYLNLYHPDVREDEWVGDPPPVPETEDEYRRQDALDGDNDPKRQEARQLRLDQEVAALAQPPGDRAILR